MRRITHLLVTAALILFGVNSAYAGKYYATISVANAATWNAGTNTMGFTAVNGWQILLTGLPSGEYSLYVTYSSGIYQVPCHIVFYE